MKQIDWQGLGGFGAVFKGGSFPPAAANSSPTTSSTPPTFASQLSNSPSQAAVATDDSIFVEFERKSVNDPAAAFQNFSKKNRSKAIQALKDAGQEQTTFSITQKLQHLFGQLSEEQRKQYNSISNKRVRVQRQGTVFASEKLEPRKLKAQSEFILYFVWILMKSIDKLYSMGVAVTMAMAAKSGKTYKYYPEEMGTERDVMKSLDQHLLQLQYSLWDEKDLGGLIMRVQNAQRTPTSKVSCKKSLADVIRPRLEALLGGSISWKKLQTGATKLLGWPLKDKDGKDRFPNRFFDLKIAEMKSILNVLDGIAIADHDRDGSHVVSVVQSHIQRIIETYEDKHKDNKDFTNYVVRLKAALSVTAGEGAAGGVPAAGSNDAEGVVVASVPPSAGQMSPPTSITGTSSFTVVAPTPTPPVSASAAGRGGAVVSQQSDNAASGLSEQTPPPPALPASAMSINTTAATTGTGGGNTKPAATSSTSGS
eukprot:jgi/Bigna1/82879/fgenesh1_pg.98_\